MAIVGADYGNNVHVVTLNGRGFMFDADEMAEIGDSYTFYLEVEKVAEFKKEAIAGYFIARCDYDGEAED